MSENGPGMAHRAHRPPMSSKRWWLAGLAVMAAAALIVGGPALPASATIPTPARTRSLLALLQAGS